MIDPKYHDKYVTCDAYVIGFLKIFWPEQEVEIYLITTNNRNQVFFVWEGRDEVQHFIDKNYMETGMYKMPRHIKEIKRLAGEL